MLMMCVGMSAWAEETWTYTFKSGNAISNNAITVNGASWTVATTSGIGSPTISTGSYSSTYGLKFGSSKSNYFGSVTFSTDYFNTKKVKSVAVKILNNGSVSSTFTAQQGSTQIGSETKTFGQTWTTLKANETAGNGGTLAFTYSLQQAFYISSITVVYEDGAAPSGPSDATWSVSPSEIAVQTGKSATATVTTNYDGELIAETNDANVATCSFEDGVLTVTGVSAGTTTITLLGEETSKYNEIEKEVTVNVTEPVAFDPSNFVIADFEEAIPAATDGNITFSLGDYSFELKKNSGSTAPTINSTAHDMRIYAEGTITISSVTKVFDGVVFNLSSQGLKRLAPITASCGKIANQKSGDETVTWTSTTPVSSVTFTVGETATFGTESTKAGQLDFTSINIKEAEAPVEPESTTITISSVLYSTYYDSEHAYVMPDDCEGYVFTKANGLELAYEAKEVVPAGEPLVIRTTVGGDKTLVFTTTSEDTYKSGDMNDLEGTDEEKDITPDTNAKFYALSVGKSGSENAGKVGFYWMAENGAAFKNGAHKAYLKLTNSSSKAFVFGEMETAIETVKSENNTLIYDLQGRRVNGSQKGLYIINGKKVVR